MRFLEILNGAEKHLLREIAVKDRRTVEEEREDSSVVCIEWVKDRLKRVIDNLLLDIERKIMDLVRLN